MCLIAQELGDKDSIMNRLNRSKLDINYFRLEESKARSISQLYHLQSIGFIRMLNAYYKFNETTFGVCTVVSEFIIKIVEGIYNWTINKTEGNISSDTIKSEIYAYTQENLEMVSTVLRNSKEENGFVGELIDKFIIISENTINKWILDKINSTNIYNTNEEYLKLFLENLSGYFYGYMDVAYLLIANLDKLILGDRIIYINESFISILQDGYNLICDLCDLSGNKPIDIKPIDLKYFKYEGLFKSCINGGNDEGSENNSL